jgi:hypothetical protein
MPDIIATGRQWSGASWLLSPALILTSEHNQNGVVTPTRRQHIYTYGYRRIRIIWNKTAFRNMQTVTIKVSTRSAEYNLLLDAGHYRPGPGLSVQMQMIRTEAARTWLHSDTEAVCKEHLDWCDSSLDRDEISVNRRVTNNIRWVRWRVTKRGAWRHRL